MSQESQLSLFEVPEVDKIVVPPPSGKTPPDRTDINPCVRLYGSGPEGTKCKTCKLLFGVQYAKRFYKCSLRSTKGASTDHKVNWNSCAKYEPLPEGEKPEVHYGG